MFKWRRQTTSPEPQPIPVLATAADPVPSPAEEPAPSPAQEKDEPIYYNLINMQLRVLDRGIGLTIVDAGAHHGHISQQYLENFNQCRVLAIEPDPENFAKASARLADFGDRVELVQAGLSDSVGTATFYRNAADATHSLLKLGDMRYYDEHFAVLPREEAVLAPQTINTLTIDSLCAARKIEQIDILKMDIQGGELTALRGAREMLSRGAIRLIVLEVNFVPMYQDMPTFWDVAEHLRSHGYGLQGLYEQRHQPYQPGILCWADAIFVSPQMQVLPEAFKPASAVDERLETVGGRPLPAEFLRYPYVTEDAAIRGEQAPAAAAPIESPEGWQSALTTVMDVGIDTSSESFRYSLVIATNPQMSRGLSAGGMITFEVSVEVTAGRLGILWADQQYQPLEGTERFVSAMPGIQRVLVSAPTERVDNFILRNAAPNSIGTSFKLAGIRGKVSR